MDSIYIRKVRTRKIIRSFAHAARFALLVVAVLGIITYWVWGCRAPWVGDIDKGLVAAYDDQYITRLNSAISSLNSSGGKDGAASLAAIIDDMAAGGGIGGRLRKMMGR